ncbi:MAG: hypothetical protein ABW034_17765 [Steroidobacteraceae bacterium]
MARYVFLAFSNPVPGRENAFLEWQKNVHIPDGLNIPGYVAATFYKLADAQILPNVAEGSGAYLTIWEIETDDIAATKAQVEKMLPSFTWSDAIADDRTRTGTYVAVAERRLAK